MMYFVEFTIDVEIALRQQASLIFQNINIFIKLTKNMEICNPFELFQYISNSQQWIIQNNII